MEKKEIRTYEQAVEYILDIPKFTKKNDRIRTAQFLKQLGCAGEDMKIIHIAGTNGKGSVCAYLCSVLREAGFSVGRFTSPHLVDVRERFVADGEMIGKEQFLSLFLKIYDRLDGEYHPAFFEYMFFIAMLFFKEKKVEYCILETGLGGRLDATNCVEKKELSVITKIGFDHMEYLGDTLTQIAAEKAGILKENTPVVYYAGREEVNETIEKEAEKKRCEAIPVLPKRDAIYKNTNKNIDFSFHSRYYGYIRLKLETDALYQAENAALAVRCIEELPDGRKMKREWIEEGLRRTFWEGRMEEILPGVYVDGAHNEDGIRAFIRSVEADGCKGRRYLLFSAVEDKNYGEMIKILSSGGLFEEAVTAGIHDIRGAGAKTLGQHFHGMKCSAAENTEQALGRLLAGKQEEDFIYIVGSLYLAGEVKALFRRKSDDQF